MDSCSLTGRASDHREAVASVRLGATKGEIFGLLRRRWPRTKSPDFRPARRFMATTGLHSSHCEANAIVDLLSIDPGIGLDQLFKNFIVIAAFVSCPFVEFGIPDTPVEPSSSINHLNSPRGR